MLTWQQPSLLRSRSERDWENMEAGSVSVNLSSDRASHNALGERPPRGRGPGTGGVHLRLARSQCTLPVGLQRVPLPTGRLLQRSFVQPQVHVVTHLGTGFKVEAGPNPCLPSEAGGFGLGSGVHFIDNQQRARLGEGIRRQSAIY